MNTIPKKSETYCRHFNGIQHSTCQAGVVCDELTGGGFGSALRLPCLREIEGDVVPCQQRVLYTPEELAQQEQELNTAVEQLVARLAQGLRVVCGERPTHMIQVSRAYYAEPCQHRQGVGNAKAWNKQWASR